MAPQSGELTLEMKRVLPASPSLVFAAFSDPDKVAKWWGPEDLTVPSLEFDPRVGASYRLEMQPPGGDPFYLTGEFREVDPPVRLAFTFVYEDPDPDDVDTLVELSFRAPASRRRSFSPRARSGRRRAARFTGMVGPTVSTSSSNSSRSYNHAAIAHPGSLPGAMRRLVV